MQSLFPSIALYRNYIKPDVTDRTPVAFYAAEKMVGRWPVNSTPADRNTLFFNALITYLDAC